MDDARSPAFAIRHAAAPARPASWGRLVLVLLGGAVVGGLLGFTFGPRWLDRDAARYEARIAWRGPVPAIADWPRPPVNGESVRAEGDQLAIRAPEREAARTLALAFARGRFSGADLDARRRATLRERAASENALGPLLPISPAAECAARLHALALALRTLSESSPGAIPSSGEAPLPPEFGPIARAAAAKDPARLDAAIEVFATAERARLAAAAGTLRAFDDTPLRPEWESRQQAVADQLEDLAAGLERRITELQRTLVDFVTPARTLAIEPLVPTPSVAVLATSLAPRAPALRRWFEGDVRLGLAGALIGGLLALLTIGLLGAVRGRPRRLRHPRANRIVNAARATPRRTGAWLQIVSGTNAHSVLHVAFELAAPALAAGRCAVIVDGTRRLALHRSLGFEAHPGLIECLGERMPSLALVQQRRVRGLRFLAQGSPQRRPVWTQLDRALEELRPHSDRVVLVVDPDVPHEVGSILAGRLMEAWWAGAKGGRREAPRNLEERIGIQFHNLRLGLSVEPSLEVLAALVDALVPRPFPEPLMLPPAGARRSAPVPVVEIPASPTLDCDLQVRERLRFLAWMRRVQAEHRREDLELAPRD